MTRANCLKGQRRRFGGKKIAAALWFSGNEPAKSLSQGTLIRLLRGERTGDLRVIRLCLLLVCRAPLNVWDMIRRANIC
jgi:hypothetical protein